MILYPKKKVTLKCHWQGLSIPGEVWTSTHSFRNQQPPGDECGLFSWGHLTWFFFWLCNLLSLYCMEGYYNYIYIIYFGRVCLGFFDWDTYPGSQAQLQVCLSNVSTFPCKAVCCLDLSMSWPSLVVGVGLVWKHKGLNPSRNLNRWILGIGENPGTRLNAKLACKSCNWIVIYPTMLSFFSGIDWVRKGLIPLICHRMT